MPLLPVRISSAFSSPVSSAAPKPAPISTPFTALMLIIADARSPVELGIDRRAQTGRHALGDHLDDGADRGAALPDAVEIAFEERRLVLVGTEERIAWRSRPSPISRGQSCAAHLHQRAAHLHLGQHLARDRTGRDAGRGLARRRTAAAAIVAQAVFRLIGEVGMAGAELVLDLGIVLRALVGVLDQQRDRRAGRHLHAAFRMRHHAGQDLHRIRLLALGGEARLAGAAAVEIALDLLHRREGSSAGSHRPRSRSRPHGSRRRSSTRNIWPKVLKDMDTP